MTRPGYFFLLVAIVRLGHLAPDVFAVQVIHSQDGEVDAVLLAGLLRELRLCTGTLRSAAILAFQKASKSAGAGIDGWIFSGATAAPSALGFAPGVFSVTSTYTMPGSSSLASMLVGLPGLIVPWPISVEIVLADDVVRRGARSTAG